MTKFLEDFQRAIIERRDVKIVMRSKADKRVIIIDAAPLDIGPRRDTPDGETLYHLWKYGYKTHTAHNVSLAPDQIVKLELKDSTFDPATIITWDVQEKPWFFPRDWGDFS